MFGHGETDLRSEVGGVLLGELAGDAGRECTRVEDIVPALLAEASTTHLTFTHATWNQIHTDIGNRQDSLRIVGWYHTHPGFGPFYSAHDTFIHSRFFVDQRHVGVVLDPVRRSLSVFGWVRNEVHRLSGCKVYATARDADELGCFSGSVVYVAD
jgi:proteasome lid subunit RPN8/RPN11